MKPKWLIPLAGFLLGCAAGIMLPGPDGKPAQTQYRNDLLPYATLRRQIVQQYPTPRPWQWGEQVSGVITSLGTPSRAIALTFDACGHYPASKKYDARLIDFLIREQVPATLFLTSVWIEANLATTRQLAANPLFEIENHGLKHRPASVNGRSAYGVPGTANVGELVDEVEWSARKLRWLTGKRPRFFRSGTAYCDEIAVRIIKSLGYQVVNYNVLGDAGATFSAAQVKNALLSSPPGAIVLAHMNHPESGTAAGVMAAVPELRKRGFWFVKLAGYLK